MLIKNPIGLNDSPFFRVAVLLIDFGVDDNGFLISG
jgi:hypothetical protein